MKFNVLILALYKTWERDETFQFKFQYMLGKWNLMVYGFEIVIPICEVDSGLLIYHMPERGT